LVPTENVDHLEDKVSGTLSRLVAKGVVKHQTNVGAYTLSAAERHALQQQIQNLLCDLANLISETADVVSRFAELNEIDYAFDAEAVAKDVLLLCDYFLLDMGRSAARAFEEKQFFNPATTSHTEFATRLANNKSIHLASLPALGLARFLDLVPQTAEAILKKPTGAAERYFGRVADSYYLLFVLRQAPEVMKVVGKVVGTSRILLDASTIVPCMAEVLMPEDERRMTILFRSAIESGVKLFVSQEAVDELLASVRKALAIRTSDRTRGFHFGNSELVESFDLYGGRSGISFSEFLNHFAGRDSPEEDLKLFLKHHLSIEFTSLKEQRAAMDQTLLEEMAFRLKPTRRHKEMDDDATNRLVQNDVKCLLLIEQLRKAENVDEVYGFSWWWLTSDRAAYALDRAYRLPKACVCMSPDFLLRYLSIQPLSPNVDVGIARHLPLAVDVAAIGMVPAEIKATVETELSAVEAMPRYMRIRRMRDLVNQARAPDESEFPSLPSVSKSER